VGILKNKTVVDYDISKIIISSLNIGISGKDMELILRKEYKIQVEYSTYNYILLITTVFNSKNDFDKLLNALFDIEKKYHNSKLLPKESLILENINIKYKPSRVNDFDYELINIYKSLNRVSYESIVPYPPGIPLINPGEIITEEAIGKIVRIKNKIKVIKEKK
jgi:arginine/lysine/ornithine decarboxylase